MVDWRVMDRWREDWGGGGVVWLFDSSFVQDFILFGFFLIGTSTDLFFWTKIFVKAFTFSYTGSMLYDF